MESLNSIILRAYSSPKKLPPRTSSRVPVFSFAPRRSGRCSPTTGISYSWCVVGSSSRNSKNTEALEVRKAAFDSFVSVAYPLKTAILDSSTHSRACSEVGWMQSCCYSETDPNGAGLNSVLETLPSGGACSFWGERQKRKHSVPSHPQMSSCCQVLWRGFPSCSLK